MFETKKFNKLLMFSFVALVMILGVWELVSSEGGQRVDIAPRRLVVSVVDASKLSREISGKDRAAFPMILRIDQTGRILGMIEGRQVSFSMDAEQLWGSENPRNAAPNLARHFGTIVPKPVAQEILVLLTLKGVCEPCDSVEQDFLEFVRADPSLDSAIVEAHVDN